MLDQSEIVAGKLVVAGGHLATEFDPVEEPLDQIAVFHLQLSKVKGIRWFVADKLALYEALVATNPAVTRKGATMPYTSLKGHMFSFLDKTGQMGLRLPRDDRDAFLERYQTTLSEQYGAVMKEYVSVPAAILAKTAELKPYFDSSYAYVGTLKPKPTKGKPKEAG